MKKRIIPVLIFIISFNFSKAGSQTDSLRTKYEIGFQLNSCSGYYMFNNYSFEDNWFFPYKGELKNQSFSFGLTGNYFISGNTFLRLKTCLTEHRIKINWDTRRDETPVSNSNYTIGNAKIKQDQYCIEPGIGWIIFDKNKIRLVVGSELIYRVFNVLNYQSSSSTYDSSSTIAYNGDGTIKVPGGWAIGLGGFSGFNVEISRHFTVGGEISSALLYSQLGGEIKMESTSSIPVIQTSTSTLYYKESGYQPARINYLINIMFHF